MSKIEIRVDGKRPRDEFVRLPDVGLRVAALRFDDRSNVPKCHAGQRKDVAVVNMQRPVTQVERSRVFRGPWGKVVRARLAAEGQVLRIEIARARSRLAGRIDGDQLYLHGACDAGNDLVLHLQEIGAIGIELIGP